MFTEIVLSPLINVIKESGERNAFCINECFYTYGQFASHISKIRDSLQLIPFENKNIGLVANDDIETYAAIFAIWMEGLAYVPLHPNTPVDRSLDIIEQAEIKLLINSISDKIFPEVQTIFSSELLFKDLNLSIKTFSENNLAYILFTSGSTGQPKGVPITRGNIAAFLQSFWETGLKITANDRCLQGYELTFDLSVQSFLAPLVRGACTYTIPHNQIKYSYLYGLLDDHQLTVLPMPPSLIRFLRPYFNEINYPCVRYNLLGAEASQVELVSEWCKCIPNAEIYNFYGPTEATIYCTYSAFSKSGDTKNLNGLMNIGKAMNGNSSVIIDDQMNILGENMKGELCISGRQLTTGYLNNPEKNLLSFFELEYNGSKQRFYRTGDLCYIDSDGDIMYGGRLDYQVKVQGYRIELGEIEFYAREYLKGRNAIAVSFENNIQNTEIALFIEGELANTKELTDYLRLKIPSYMIPARIEVQNIFPLNSNGKIDRNILKKSLTI